jgi:hypothetical protein
MKREGDPASVRMDVVPVTSFLALEGEAIGLESGGESASGKGPEA